MIRRSHALRNSPAAIQNESHWKVFKTIGPVHSSCKLCVQMINGLPADLVCIGNDTEMKFLFENSMVESQNSFFQINKNNLTIIHQIHEALQASEDFFKTFDVIFTKHFQHSDSERNILH